MVSKSRARLALAGFVLVAAAVGLTGAGGVAAGVLFGLPLVLFIPGYVLVEALMPSLARATLERIVLSIGLSLAVAVLSGLALNWTPWGIGGRQSTVLLSLLALSAIFFTHVRERRQRVTAEEWPGRVSLERYGLNWRRLGMIGVAGLLVTTAVIFSAQSATLANPGFTETWITQEHSGSVEVGVRNRTSQEQTYRLQLTIDGRSVLSQDQLRLAPGQQWSAAVPTGLASGEADLGVTGADPDTHLDRQLHVLLAGGSAR
jgi:uncharacterized membrane protein